MSVNIASSGTSFFPTKIEKEMQELHLNFKNFNTSRFLTGNMEVTRDISHTIVNNI